MNAPNQLSFLPDDYLARKAQRRTNLICALLFVVVMGAIGSAFTLTERSLRRVEREHADVQRQYAEAAKRLDQVKLMQENQRKMARQAELTASLLEKIPRSNLLAELTNALPDGVSLLDMSLDSKRRAAATPIAKSNADAKKAEVEKKNGGGATNAPPEPKLYDVFVKLEGIASNNTQVAEYLRNLGKSKLLKDINLAVVDEAKFDEEQVRKFQIDMMLSRDADLQTDTRAAAAAATATPVKADAKAEAKSDEKSDAPATPKAHAKATPAPAHQETAAIDAGPRQ